MVSLLKMELGFNINEEKIASFEEWMKRSG